MTSLPKARTPAAAELTGSGGGVSTAAPCWNGRLRTRKRCPDASTSSSSPSPAFRRQTRKRRRDASAPAPAARAFVFKPSKKKSDQAVEIGSVDDANAEFVTASLFHLTQEEMLPYYNRLYKKRANMGLAWYHESNQEDRYEFTNVHLSDVYNFMDDGVCYMHMNFRARNEATRSEKLFFAELALTDNVFNQYGGYVTTTCSIVDDNCLGGMKHRLDDGLPTERRDKQHCYVCSKDIKHPKGESYKGGHYAENYCVDGDD
ncbi:hypothetical protein EJB05_16208 [Eragrostis curvula]|uniref:DUF3615 domain-containing protein n=1 Tax=Eragrostis curvula TaxID=38414 RepID=A0A5J9VEG0_9POAL|nr:hypothetical protein EJB05_16208 [Eragrostis curvula]